MTLWFDARNKYDMSGALAGKTALVTGASRGIGRAIALKLAQAGCDVAILYHNSHEEAESVCGTIRGLGRRALAIQADVGEPDSVAEAFQTLRKDSPQQRCIRIIIGTILISIVLVVAIFSLC